MLRDVVKVFPVSSSSFARKTTRRNRARSHSRAWRGLKTKWVLKLSFRIRHISSDTCLSKSEQQLPKLKLDAFQLWQLRRLSFQSFLDPSEIPWRACGATEAPCPRDSLNFGRASLLSRNELESWAFTIVLHATSSFTYASVSYGANFPFKSHPWKRAGGGGGGGFRLKPHIEVRFKWLWFPIGIFQSPNFSLRESSKKKFDTASSRGLP